MSRRAVASRRGAVLGFGRDSGTSGGIMHVDRKGLKVAAELADFLEARVLPGTGVDPGDFWTGFAAILTDLAPENRALLARREALPAGPDRPATRRSSGTSPGRETA